MVAGEDFNANVRSLQCTDEEGVVGQEGSSLRDATLITWVLMNGLHIASRQSSASNVDDS